MIGGAVRGLSDCSSGTRAVRTIDRRAASSWPGAVRTLLRRVIDEVGVFLSG